MSPHSYTIQTKDLITGYTSGRQCRKISGPVDLTAINGELVMLMGPNGCGKSTLMRTIAGLQKPLGGDVMVAGKEINQLKVEDKAKLLSLVLTDRITGANLTVSDIVSIGRYPHIGFRGKLRGKDRQIIAEALSCCMLKGFEQRVVDEMSDGERQRTMIARALVQQTPVMLLDEPTAHLDLPGRMEIMMMLKELSSTSGKCILVTTHELELTLQWADTVWLMNGEGEIRCGAPEDMVLQNRYAEVFGNDKIDFDSHKGQFVVKRNGHKSVYLRGSGLSYDWTARAIERHGFSIIIGGDCYGYPRVEVGTNEWIVLLDAEKLHNCHSIREVIHSLHRVKQ